MRELLYRIRKDAAAMRLQEAQGQLVNTDAVDIDFECPCGQGMASVMISFNTERVVVTPLCGHDCFEPLWLDLDELFVSDNPIARAAVDALEAYYEAINDSPSHD